MRVFHYVCLLIGLLAAATPLQAQQEKGSQKDTTQKDTLEGSRPDTATTTSEKDKVKESIFIMTDSICFKLGQIKKNTELLSIGLLGIWTALKVKDEKQYKEVLNAIEELIKCNDAAIANVPKLKIQAKKISTKVAIATSIDELFRITDDITAMVEEINKSAEAFDLTPVVIENLGEYAGTSKLLKKYFTSCVGMLEGLADRLNRYVELFGK